MLFETQFRSAKNSSNIKFYELKNYVPRANRYPTLETNASIDNFEEITQYR